LYGKSSRIGFIGDQKSLSSKTLVVHVLNPQDRRLTEEGLLAYDNNNFWLKFLLKTIEKSSIRLEGVSASPEERKSCLHVRSIMSVENC
jgi:hypothetical protein